MIRLIKASHDIYNRNKAILYIDGEVYTDHAHGDALRQYVDEYMPYAITRDGEKDDWNFLINNNPILEKLPMGFAHLVENPVDKEKPGIYVEPFTENCDLQTVINAIKQKFPDMDIYDDEEYGKKLARLNKIAVSPTTREKAILYVDGEIYEGENHTQIINKLCDEKREKGEFVDPNWVYDVPMAFIHVQKDDGRYKEGLYVEDDSLMNCTLDEVINVLKNKYPDTPIYSNTAYDEKTDYYTRLANKIKSKLAFDVNNRDNAILYINGEVYQNSSHSECIKEYIENHFGKEEDVSSARQDGEEILEEYGLDELPIAFAHLVVNDPDVNKGIYLETGTIKGVSKQEVVNELKDQYGLKVYDNNSKKEI